MDKDEIRQKIAIELFESGFLTKTAKNLLKTSDKNIIDMFVSDIIYIILTFKPVSKIYNLLKKNEIEYFVTKIMLNQINSKTSTWNTYTNPKLIYLDDVSQNKKNKKDEDN